MKAVTPHVLMKLREVYKKSNDNGKAFHTVNKVIYHNNEPVNILVAMTVLKDVKCLRDIGWCTPLDYEYTLRYLSEHTGYNVLELESRL